MAKFIMKIPNEEQKMGTLTNGKTYQSGNATLTVGKDLFQMKSSADIIMEPLKLKKVLAEQGYLYFPNFYDPKDIAVVKAEIADRLAAKGILNPDKSPLSLELNDACPKSYMFKPEEFVDVPNYIKLVESKKIMDQMKLLLDDEIFTYPYKWLRAIKKGDATGIHYDIVYMGRGTDQLLTCWTALDDTPPEKGGLLMGSNFKNTTDLKNTYGKIDVDRDHLNSGWYTKDPREITQQYGGVWHTSHFNGGDIVIFGMYQLHGSLQNETNQLRITCDTRYQRASEPKDERWSNKTAVGHVGNGVNKIEDLKKIWSQKSSDILI